jgi:hypothetical protein
MVAATQAPLQALQVAGGAVQLLGPAAGGGLGPRRGPHQHTAHHQLRLPPAVATPGREGDGALQHPVGPWLGGRLGGGTAGDIVDRAGLLDVQATQELGGQVGLAGRCDEGHLGGVHRHDVAAAEQLGVPDQQQLALASQVLERGHRLDHLGDLAGTAVIGAMPHRHPAVAADRQAGLDLLEVRAAVLGLAPARLRKPASGPRRRHTARSRSCPSAAGPHRSRRWRSPAPPPTRSPAPTGQRPRSTPARSGRRSARPGQSPRPPRPPTPAPSRSPAAAAGAGQTVGDQRLDHLPVGHPRDLPDRASPIHDPCRSRRRQNSATTGSAPSSFSTLGGP